MRFGRLVLLTLAALSATRAQEAPPAAPPGLPQIPAAPAAPPVLENNGKPIALPFACTAEDVQTAGLTCSEDDPCPVYLELTGVESVGTRIFAAGNLHTQTVTMFSTLLGSDDAGHTWREVHERLRAASLDRIQFLDPETGWASGETLSPLPQDPFLLLTADGGKTWRQRFVFDENAENHLGTIQQFLFTARDEGSLIVDRGQGSDGDRYELYESPDGGQSWGIRQSSNKPLRLKQAPAADVNWRIRADRQSAAFHLERRQGTTWAQVASFLVKVGSCKP
jgi:photosystem II stability/assembly factor-like uncharacterized protein